MFRLSLCWFVLASGSSLLAQDIDSGPPKGGKIPELKVHAVSGPVQGETLDYAARCKDGSTIYVFIQADKFSRPAHAFLRTLDQQADKQIKGSLVVAVWLTDNQQKTKDYLPKITPYYANAAITYFPGEKAGPQNWFVNDQADVTVILAHKGQVVDRFGYNSINETVAPEVLKAFKKALPAPPK